MNMEQNNLAETKSRDAAHRPIEVITAEIWLYKQQAGSAILEIGSRLNEAKSQLSHGEWLPWLEEKVEFSEATAQRFMRLAREYENPSPVTDLGASKALQLLALPASEREGFLAEKHAVNGQEKTVTEMSRRELAQAIRDRDAARKAAETARADAAAAEQARSRMEADMRLVNAALASARAEKERADQESTRLERELTELKNRPVEVAVETAADPEAIARARAEAVAEMQAKLDKAKEAKAKADDKRKRAEASVEILKKSLEEREKAEKKAALGADKEVAQFEVLFLQGQELANKMKGYLIKARGREDRTAALGMEKALKALAEAIGRCAE